MNQLILNKKNELVKKKKKGFTLVELIIVIAIIAILAAIAIPKFGQITRNANIKADIATAKNLHGIAAQLIAEGTIVPSADDTDVTTTVQSNVDGGTISNTKLDKNKQFKVAVNANGDVVVYSGTIDDDNEIYPNSSSYGELASDS